MVQTIFSALCGQNPNRIKTNKNPPNPQIAEGMQEVLKNRLIQMEVIKVALLSLMHIYCVKYCCFLSYSSTGQMGDLRNGHVN